MDLRLDMGLNLNIIDNILTPLPSHSVNQYHASSC
jgi:hypothetical protein